MDPISQGTLGGLVPTAVWKPNQIRTCVVLGCLAGLAPDLDVFISSTSDPLLFLEYHRQFTHALLFIPVGALFVATICYPVSRRWMRFKHSYLVCLLGYGTHGLLDSCTTYGTQLFWPFSDYRVAWNVVSIIDPILTVPLLLLLIIAVVKKRPAFARVGVAWLVLYLSFGLIQHERAIQEGLRLAQERGHSTTMLSAKPTFANLIAWKIIYLDDGVFHVDAIRTGFSIRRCGGTTATQLNLDEHFPWLDATSQQAIDIERFSWFSQDYVAIDPKDEQRIIDMRYTLAPNRIDALWGIRVDPNTPHTQHAHYSETREMASEQTQALIHVVTGQSCD